MIRIFLSYAHADEKYRVELDKHLKVLKRRGLIDSWNDRCLMPGDEWGTVIDDNLRSADIVLLLVSVDFINSEYCFELEMGEALARHERGECIVIPIILRPCLWQDLPFGKLQAGTRDGKPVEKYPSLDDAFLEVTQGLETVVKKIQSQKNQSIPSDAMMSYGFDSAGSQVLSKSPSANLPRSSNLFIPKTFTDHDKDVFVTDAFNFMARYFEGSLEELQKRNPEINARFSRVDANSFEGTIYRHGQQISKCGIWLTNGSSGWSARGIQYSSAGLGQRNSYNGSLTVNDNGNMLGLEPLMSFTHNDKKPLTFEGSAEYFWVMFFEPLQRL